MLNLVVDNTAPHVADVVQVAFNDDVHEGVIISRINGKYRVWFMCGAALLVDQADIVNNLTLQDRLAACAQ